MGFSQPPVDGQRSTGIVIAFRCPGCGERLERRFPWVPVHALNEERRRAERAEARVRELESRTHADQ